MGLGIFAPTPNSNVSRKPSEQAEGDAREICALVKKSVAVAEPYFEWRAEEAASGSKVNVVNKSSQLFDRFVFFRDRYRSLLAEAQIRENDPSVNREKMDQAAYIESNMRPYYLRKEAEWNAQAAVEAFFSWTEHAFIHLAILQGRLRSGEDVADIAEADWKTKFKVALDVSDPQTKSHYDKLLDLRAQIRNFMAHGAFGKRGEAFRFHSGAGAVPVLLTRRQQHRYALTGDPAFDERWAIQEIEEFISHLWSGPRKPAYEYIHSSLPTILTYVSSGTYAYAMKSVAEMKELVEHLEHEVSTSADMDW
jgi:hypothetical protein